MAISPQHLVLQYERISASQRIVHLAIVKEGGLSASYQLYRGHLKHREMCRYLCTENTPEYSSWDNLKASILSNIAASSVDEFCPICFRRT